MRSPFLFGPPRPFSACPHKNTGRRRIRSLKKPFPAAARSPAAAYRFSFLINFKSARFASNVCHRRYPGSLLGPGALAAHRSFRLVLLHSCPDTVHGFLLRKTRTSTPLTGGSPAVKTPSAKHHPCYSGLQVQGTANSPAVRKLYDLGSTADPRMIRRPV